MDEEIEEYLADDAAADDVVIQEIETTPAPKVVQSNILANVMGANVVQKSQPVVQNEAPKPMFSKLSTLLGKALKDKFTAELDDLFNLYDKEDQEVKKEEKKAAAAISEEDSFSLSE